MKRTLMVLFGLMSLIGAWMCGAAVGLTITGILGLWFVRFWDLTEG